MSLPEPDPDGRAPADSGIVQVPPSGSLKWQHHYSGRRVGRFRLGPRLGIGGAASVYLARLAGPHEFERLAAVKIVHEHLSEEPEFVTMFLDEAKVVSRLSHPNIVHVYELGRDLDLLFLAMEFLDGQSLAQLYRAVESAGERLPYDLVAWIGARAAEGLHHAHELTTEAGQPLCLVHRDVSPDNIFVTYQGHVKLIDFGIARALGRLTTTAVGHIKGKYRYMAPEQALGRELDHRVDVFSLGATLYEAALGFPVFAGEDDADTLGKLLTGSAPDPCATIPGFPAQLGAALLRALAPRPEDRFATAAELGRALDAFVARSGETEQRERLAHTMDRLFASQRRATTRAIAELRALDTLEDGATPTVAPEPTRSSRWAPRVAIGAAILGAGALLAALGVRALTPLPAPAVPSSAAAVPELVTLDVLPQPEAATVTIDGQVVPGHPARRRMPRGQSSVRVQVQAPGYQSTALLVIPDRDQSLVVPLVKLAPVPLPTVSAGLDVPTQPRSPGGAPSPGAPAGKPPPRNPPPGKPSPEKPPPEKPPPGKIVTEYPSF